LKQEIRGIKIINSNLIFLIIYLVLWLAETTADLVGNNLFNF